MFSGGETVVVGLSGGPDSTALVHVLGRLRTGARLVIAHVDHGLTEDSEADAAEVARRAAESGLDVHVARARGLEGPNLHARARDFRYSFFETIAAQEGAALIATGHTLDDRVETSLQRFIHGAGTRGLAGIPYVGPGGLRRTRRIRPLLDLRRAETRAYCTEVGLDFLDDPANADPRFERASVRELLIGAIEQRWGDGAIRAMAKSLDRLSEDEAALQGQADLLFRGSADDDGRGTVSLARSMMQELPRALRRRLLEIAVGDVRDRGPGIDEVLDALERPDLKPGARFDLAESITVEVGSETILITGRPATDTGPDAPA